MAPQDIRPHSDYNVSLTLHNEAPSTVVKLSIIDDENYKNSKEVKLTSNHSEIVSLHIDNLNRTKQYRLIAEGLSGIVFKNESNVRIYNKNVSIFVYTDKAIYKPGETIKFRVLVMDLDLKPARLMDENQFIVYISVSIFFL